MVSEHTNVTDYEGLKTVNRRGPISAAGDGGREQRTKGPSVRVSFLVHGWFR